jgi:sugar fermentation stimulation protein A
MRFPGPLTRGTLLRRYKRFLADVVLESGEQVTTHVANSGSMLGLTAPGLPVFLSHQPKPTRKLAWSWELVEIGGCLVGVNTMHPNGIVADAVVTGTVSELTGYNLVRREVPYGKNSRIDLLLSAPDRPICYVEVKNVTLKRGDAACFPDAVTARGTKHLDELIETVIAGARAVMVFVVQREDCRYFTVADAIDSVYGATLRRAMASGVEAICYACCLSPEEIRMAHPLPLRLGGAL